MDKHADEILDIVDDNNNIIGQASRLEVHQKNLKHRSAHVFVIHNGDVFLQLRAPNKAQFPNLWDTSSAGHLDSGESYIDSAVRELNEELGIKAKTSDLQEVGALPATKENGYEFVKIYILNLKQKPKLELAYNEITTGGWFSIEHVNKWLKVHPESFAGGFNTIWGKVSSQIL